MNKINILILFSTLGTILIIGFIFFMISKKNKEKNCKDKIKEILGLIMNSESEHVKVEDSFMCLMNEIKEDKEKMQCFTNATTDELMCECIHKLNWGNCSLAYIDNLKKYINCGCIGAITDFKLILQANYYGFGQTHAWKTVKNAALQSDTVTKMSGTVEECKTFCIAQQPICKSFDYIKDENTCLISEHAADDKEEEASLIHNPQRLTDYYELVNRVD